ncbi:MAG: TPM domain-containing protein [Candidatus Absconditicoccaceae bacterium]
MKKIGLLILSILCLMGISFAHEIDPMHLPRFEYFVNDYSQALSQEEFEELNQLAETLETTSGYQVVTVLFPHREGNEFFDIALKAFNENGIGDKDRNDGLLLAIATEEKKIRIMVGYGLEAEIPDALAKAIIEALIRPEVNSGNLYQGIKNFYSFFSDQEIKAQVKQLLPEEEDSSSQMTFLGVYAVLLAALVLRGSTGKGGSSRGSWRSSSSSSSSSSSWGGSSGGGGGFSGGGGSSGGGGAGD